MALLRCAMEQVPRVLLLLTKQDLWDGTDTPPVLAGEDLPPVLEISSRTGYGLDRLEQAIEALFPPDAAQDSGEMLTNARQAGAAGRALEGVRSARKSLAAGMTPDAVLVDVEGAMEALGELTGRSLREDVTARIFERFCVGK